MKILTGKDIKGADIYTIENEPIESIALMERAAEILAQAIAEKTDINTPLMFFIGKGNNGGDGLAVARILWNAGFACSVYMALGTDGLSDDCRSNFERLPDALPIVGIEDVEDAVASGAVIIDALLGSGVEGDLRPGAKEVIGLINSMPAEIISIDLPSGMKTEFGNIDISAIVHADSTLAIEFPKLAMLLPEAGDCCGEITVLPIHLAQEYIDNAESGYEYMTDISPLLTKRAKFAHKNQYGHALLICGSEPMGGAAVLSAGGALRSGCGLVTVHVPKAIAGALSSNTPSAMLSLDSGNRFSTMPEYLDKYTVVGIGCGLGRADETRKALMQLLKEYEQPMVFDADALNMIAESGDLPGLVPAGSVLTPHPGEFARLAGEWGSEEEKLQKLRDLATGLSSVIVLKGAHTAVCSPLGQIFFNSTGTPGMAKGGSGDVLTGYITGLIGRGYSPLHAALIGVYIHGIAGEKAAAYYGEEGMNSSDIIDFLGEAMTEIG